MKITRLTLLATLSILLLAGATSASAQSARDRIAALKGNVSTSKIILHQYEWIQTTTVSLNGDVKSTKQERCFYGDDGSLQKVEISDEQAQQRQGLLFHRIREHKKEELTEYMQNAVALAKSYFPPSASKIQNARDNGNVNIQPLSSGRARVTFTSYQLPGDSYSVEISGDNRPLNVKVNSYLNDPDDVVKLTAEMGQLNNGTTYVSDITLNAENKGVTVTVHNGGYQRRE